MSGRTVNSAMLLLVIGNAMALISDVFIKLLSGETGVFQFVFVRSLLTLLLLAPFLGFVNRRRLFEGLRIHALRAHIHMAGIAFMVVALGAMPLATANAIFYAAPLLIVVLSVTFMGERLSWQSALAVASGFIGILVILRPTEIGWVSLTALATALALAINAVLVRKLPRNQSMVHKLVLTYLLSLPAAALLMWLEAAPWQPGMLVNAFGSTVFILGYNVTVLLAYHQVDANQVTSAEYTGLIWAVLIGWWWFKEVPDVYFVAGSLLIVVPLLLVGLRHWLRRRPHTLKEPA
ncbi:MAG: DMT family transporter [Marinobacter sp.]|nr:DMT family transporter [Marinobacter sp.]